MDNYEFRLRHRARCKRSKLARLNLDRLRLNPEFWDGTCGVWVRPPRWKRILRMDQGWLRNPRSTWSAAYSYPDANFLLDAVAKDDTFPRKGNVDAIKRYLTECLKNRKSARFALQQLAP